MAFSNYAELKQEVIAYSGRDDLSDRFDSFLSLTESAMFNNDQKPLRVREMESTAALVTVGGTNSVALPSDFLEARSLSIEYGGQFIELKYESPSVLQPYDSGIPMAFTIKGSTLVFNVTPDGVYDLNLDYYAKPTALTATNSTNVILTNYPEIYFYGCLSRVYTFTTENAEAESYYTEFIRAIRGAIKSTERAIRKIPSAKYKGSTP
jgi:hypothetical protein